MSAPFKSSRDVPPVQGRSFRLALLQLGCVSPDKPSKLAHARSQIAAALSSAPDGRKPDVVVLPEIFNSPYETQHLRNHAEVIGWPGNGKAEGWKIEACPSESVRMLSQAAKESGVWLFGGSIPERSADSQDTIYNTATAYSPSGELVALHRKLHLFDIDIPGGITFKESETLTAGNEAVTIVDTDFGKIALGICYDIRFPEMTMIGARKGCVLALFPAAFNLTTGPLHWELLQRARALDNQIYVATCSPARDMSASYHAWGHSTVVDPMGKVVATTDEGPGIVYADIDLEEINKTRRGIPVTVQRRFDVYKDVSAGL